MPALLTLLVGLIAGILIFYLILRLRSPYYVKTKPEFSESDAESLLVRNGYKVKDKQKSHPIVIYIDGKSHFVTASADFIVERENKKYAIKVVSSQELDPTEPQTRRALIEIRSAFPKHELLLVNLATSEISLVKLEFPSMGKDLLFTFLLVLTIIFVVSLVIFLMIQLKLV